MLLTYSQQLRKAGRSATFKSPVTVLHFQAENQNNVTASCQAPSQSAQELLRGLVLLDHCDCSACAACPWTMSKRPCHERVDAMRISVPYGTELHSIMCCTQLSYTQIHNVDSHATLFKTADAGALPMSNAEHCCCNNSVTATVLQLLAPDHLQGHCLGPQCQHGLWAGEPSSW